MFDCRSGLNSCRVHGIIRISRSEPAGFTDIRPAGSGGTDMSVEWATVLVAVGVNISGLVVSGFRRMGDRFGSLEQRVCGWKA